ncbi:hypothetical protein PAXINDRAFT_17446 [Paxillus involutus ATCC 200175]|uniref:Uncharacterized protein n=1 Tax=Paxillus involutus ATCC 200175 TaxID=664439 RepID=A0A0C9T157_PAXIN|nr:hypothetical protein PAXINDRAFT_17446 [Paxillus involutus ATCC 200175]
MGITYWPLGGRVLPSPKSAHLWVRHSYRGGGRLSPGIWDGASSLLVRKIINENHMDLKRMIDWWTTVIKFTHIQDSEEGPSMPAIGSGRAVNLIEYLYRAGKPVRDHNRRVLKAMVLKLLIPHGYVKWSDLWKRLCHEA